VSHYSAHAYAELGERGWRAVRITSKLSSLTAPPSYVEIMSLHDPDFSCNTIIAGNTDVGGPGVRISHKQTLSSTNSADARQVIGSFAVVAWLTVILGFIPVWFETKDMYQESRKLKETSPTARGNGLSWQNSNNASLVESGRAQNSDQDKPSQLSDNYHQDQKAIPLKSLLGRSYTIPGVGGAQATSATEAMCNGQRVPLSTEGYDDGRRRYADKIINILGSLGDLQAITSLGIIISGIVNRNDLTFYHEQLVLISYDMALNSFWVTRINYMNVDSDDNKWRLLLRRGAVLASLVLAIYYQAFVYLRENKWPLWPEYDSIPEDSSAGHCYRYMDQSNTNFSFYFWVVGEALFAFALALCLFPYTRRWNEQWFFWTMVITWYLWEEMRASWDQFLKSEEGSRLTKLQTVFRTGFQVLFYGIMTVLWFLLLQLLAVWSYGDGFYPLTWFCYLAFLVWNTFDLISLVVVNYSMVQGNELTTWGFGQVLPVVVAVLSIITSVIDEFTGQCYVLLTCLL
jgi:hypothetical protein